MTKSRTVEEMAAPLGSIESGRLVFTRGASHLELRVDAQMEDLYRARFEGKVPEIRVTDGTVSVRYRSTLHPPSGEITLSGRIPWALEARWGMSDVTADLQELELTSLEISGGASKVEVRMPHPKVAVPIRIGGGASDITVIRPEGVPIRVRTGGGSSNLTIDDLRFASAGKTDWQSPDYEGAEARYDIEIGAGTSAFTVRT